MNKKKFLLLFLIINILSSWAAGANAAVQVAERESYDLDAKLLTQPDNFALPQSIIVTPLFMQSDEIISESEWYKGLYYYLTARLNQGDFVYHYVVLQDGTIVKANQKGEEQRIPMQTAAQNPVIIAYLARKDDLDFSEEAKSKMQELILEVANAQAIPLANVFTHSTYFVSDTENTLSLKSDPLSGRWERSVNKMVENVLPRYNPTSKTYDFEIVKVESPSAPVNYGDNVIINVTIKNNSKHALFQGTDFEPLISKTGGDGLSKFYLNGIWLSLTQASLMPEGAVLLPGATATYQWRIGVPLYFGEQNEEFELINSLGQPYASSNFSVKINVNRLDKEVIEITDTETGQLNVRAAATGSSQVISRVTPGQRFIVLERSDGGWVKIDLGNNESGWVSRQYTKVV